MIEFGSIDEDKVSITIVGDIDLKDYFKELPRELFQSYNTGDLTFLDKKIAAQVWIWCKEHCWRPKYVEEDLKSDKK